MIILAAMMMFAGPGSIHKFKVPSIDGGSIDFSKFKGKKILVVNTASKCGYTPQYADLEKLYKAYKDKLVVVGFPANNFGGQEPGSNEQIAEFCQKNYGVSFVMAEKVSENGVMDAEIKWNFTKFLLDEKGKLIGVYPSKVNPMSEEITKHLN
jgi:glutathione peroxidase